MEVVVVGWAFVFVGERPILGVPCWLVGWKVSGVYRIWGLARGWELVPERDWVAEHRY